VKTLIVTLVAVVSLVLAGFAFADSSGSSASQCGAAHGAFADQNGNFGWLGPMGGTPGYHNGAVGQDPDATGYNNSHTDCQGG
jgi:hypothetical protein